MITRSISLQRCLVREMERHAGSLARLVYYEGVMPASCAHAADGQKLKAEDLPEGFMHDVLYGEEPQVPEGVYWRVLTNDGAVMLQGDGT